MGKVATGADDPRRFRYPEDDWMQVKQMAAAEHRTASEVIRLFLDAYRAGSLGVLPDGRFWMKFGAGDDR